MYNVSRQHQDILKQITSSPARSSKNGFTNTSRLNVINGLLDESPFSLVYKGTDTWMYAQKRLSFLPDQLLVITAHVDVVTSISNKGLHSDYDEKRDCFTGNYDNGGCAAAAVLMMREYDLPDNTVFCFDADEETGRCNGVKEVCSVLKSSGKRFLAVALDATYENARSCLYSIENPCVTNALLKAIGEKMLSLDEGFKWPTARFVPKNKHTDLSWVPVMNKSTMSSWFDEGAAFGRQNVDAVSFCLPMKDGDMHSNHGCRMDGAVFDGYIMSLASFVYVLDRSHEEELESLTAKRKALADELFERTELKAVSLPDYGEYKQMSLFDYADDEALTEDDEALADEYMTWLLEQAERFDDEESFYEYTDAWPPAKFHTLMMEYEELWEYPSLAWDAVHSENMDER